jgi:hypothetical protein
MARLAISTASSSIAQAFEYGARRQGVRLRDVDTLDDVGEPDAPEPGERGDVVATGDGLWRVEVVRVTPSGANCVPVLALRAP